MNEDGRRLKGEEHGNEFARTAIRLLKESTGKLEAARAEAVRVLEARHREVGLTDRAVSYLAARFQDQLEEFYQSMNRRMDLSRQASQWLMHGDISSSLKLELEFRLNELEQMGRYMHDFFNRHHVK